MTNMFMTEESVDLLNSICAGRPVEFAAEFTTCIPQIIETVSTLPTGTESPIYIKMTANMHGLIVPATIGDALSLYKCESHA